jgi:Fur family transcriptional regulator, zinc uptake regulator
MMCQNSSTDINLHRAQQRCDKKGVSLTSKRKNVLKLLLDSPNSLSAYDIIDLFNTTYNQNSPATSIYRILKFLESQHLIHKIQLTKKYIACTHITCQHIHNTPQFLICNLCNFTQEFHLQEITLNNLLADIKQSGFTLSQPQLEFRGLCKNCSN